MSKLVPFGKYKGYPLKTILADTEYCEWLQGQGWFGSRYAEYKTLVINQGAQLNETPEHNALQARFLDNEFCIRLFWLLYGEVVQHRYRYFKSLIDGPDESKPPEPSAPVPDRDDRLARVAAAEERLEAARAAYALVHRPDEGEEDDGAFDRAQLELGNALNASAQAGLALDAPAPVVVVPFKRSRILDGRVNPARVVWKSFEEKGWDVCFKVEWTISALMDDGREEVREREEAGVACELKPSLGDDYPAVLRQVKSYEAPGRSMSPAVVVGRYTGQGATLDQVRQIFAGGMTGRVSLVTLGEMLALDLSAPHGHHFVEMPK